MAKSAKIDWDEIEGIYAGILSDMEPVEIFDKDGLAARLRKYEIKSTRVHERGDKQLSGYERTDLHDTWLRYLGPPPDRSVTSVTG